MVLQYVYFFNRLLPPFLCSLESLNQKDQIFMNGFDAVGDLGSSSSWVNSFGSSQGQCQIQAPEIIYEMIDQSSGKAAVGSSSPAGWPESYINNSISNPMAAAGDSIVWTAGNSNVAAADASGSNPTNNSAAISQWPDYMPGFCAPP